jgi:hypothetical protein
MVIEVVRIYRKWWHINMNKQFEELVNKTDAWCDANFPSDWLNRVDEFLPLWNNKFAEIIVQECIGVINKTPNGYRDYRNQIEDAMRNACVDDIKQHFGVE